MIRPIHVFLVCGGSAAISCSAFSQAPLKPRPVVTAPKPFVVPYVAERTYPNGMRLALVPFRATPTARIELVIRAGSADEGVDQLGAAQLVGQFLLEGTVSRSGETIAQLISDLGAVGGAINVNTGAYETIIGVDVLPEAAPAMVELFADLVQRPAFPAAALERLKSNALRRLQLQSSQADWLASSRTNSLLFPGHAADRVPSEAQIRALNPEAITRFHASLYAPRRSRLYVAGTFDQVLVERAVAGTFGAWERQGSPPFALPPPSNPRLLSTTDRPLIHLVDRPGATQARVQVSFPVVDQPHPDHLILNEINTLMGSTQTARIVANIRERHGYSYNISTRLVRRPGSTQWVVAGDITNNVVGAALREILAETARLRTETPPVEELRGFQSFMSGILVSENSTARGVLETLRWMDLYGVKETYLANLIQSIHAVSPETIRQIASRYLVGNRMTVVVVGDRKALASQLEGIGQVVD